MKTFSQLGACLLCVPLWLLCVCAFSGCFAIMITFDLLKSAASKLGFGSSGCSSGSMSGPGKNAVTCYTCGAPAQVMMQTYYHRNRGLCRLHAHELGLT